MRRWKGHLRLNDRWTRKPSWIHGDDLNPELSLGLCSIEFTVAPRYMSHTLMLNLSSNQTHLNACQRHILCSRRKFVQRVLTVKSKFQLGNKTQHSTINYIADFVRHRCFNFLNVRSRVVGASMNKKLMKNEMTVSATVEFISVWGEINLDNK